MAILSINQQNHKQRPRAIFLTVARVYNDSNFIEAAYISLLNFLNSSIKMFTEALFSWWRLSVSGKRVFP